MESASNGDIWQTLLINIAGRFSGAGAGPRLFGLRPVRQRGAAQFVPGLILARPQAPAILGGQRGMRRARESKARAHSSCRYLKSRRAPAQRPIARQQIRIINFISEGNPPPSEAKTAG